MKKTILFLLLFAFNYGTSQTQNPIDYDKYRFSKPADYKAAEEDVLKTANALLNSDTKAAKLDRLKATQFIMRWMEGTPDHTFTLDRSVEIIDGDTNLMGILMAAYAKYHIENIPADEAAKQTRSGVWALVAECVENPAHNIKANKELKKLVNAKNSGKLHEFLSKFD